MRSVLIFRNFGHSEFIYHLFSGFDIRPFIGLEHHVKKLNPEISPSYVQLSNSDSKKALN